MNKYNGVIELIARIVVKREDKILLCLNKKANTYFLPGGHVEFGDTLEKTIYKETAEELGWTEDDIKSIKFNGYLENSFTSTSGTDIHAELNMIFDVEIGLDVKTQSQESHIEFQWIDRANLPSITLLPKAISQFIL